MLTVSSPIISVNKCNFLLFRRLNFIRGSSYTKPAAILAAILDFIKNGCLKTEDNMEFYPRDATLSMALCLSVCVCRKSVFYRNTKWLASSSWVFWHGGFVRPLTRWLIRKFRKFVPNSGLRKFRHGKSIVLSTKLIDGRTCWPQLRRSMLYTQRARGLLHVCRP